MSSTSTMGAPSKVLIVVLALEVFLQSEGVNTSPPCSTVTCRPCERATACTPTVFPVPGGPMRMAIARFLGRNGSATHSENRLHTVALPTVGKPAERAAPGAAWTAAVLLASAPCLRGVSPRPYCRCARAGARSETSRSVVVHALGAGFVSALSFAASLLAAREGMGVARSDAAACLGGAMSRGEPDTPAALELEEADDPGKPPPRTTTALPQGRRSLRGHGTGRPRDRRGSQPGRKFVHQLPLLLWLLLPLRPL